MGIDRPSRRSWLGAMLATTSGVLVRGHRATASAQPPQPDRPAEPPARRSVVVASHGDPIGVPTPLSTMIYRYDLRTGAARRTGDLSPAEYEAWLAKSPDEQWRGMSELPGNWA